MIPKPDLRIIRDPYYIDRFNFVSDNLDGIITNYIFNKVYEHFIGTPILPETESRMAICAAQYLDFFETSGAIRFDFIAKTYKPAMLLPGDNIYNYYYYLLRK